MNIGIDKRTELGSLIGYQFFPFWWRNMDSILPETELLWFMIYASMISEDKMQWIKDYSIESDLYFSEYGDSTSYKVRFYSWDFRWN